MAHPQIATFARLADGGAKPTRKIEGQKTLLSRTIHSVAYDEIHDEFFIPVPFPEAILAFRGAANGEEAPIRIIQGPLTQIRDSNRLAIDPVNNEIYIPDDDRILVFPREGNGNIAPIRVLEGPDTGLAAGAMAVDPVRNLLVVANSRGRDGFRLVMFNRTAKGNAKPLRSIGGPKSGLTSLGGPFIVYPPKGWILAGIRGGDGLADERSYLGIWSIEDGGDVPPRWTVGGPRGVFLMPRGVAIDPVHKEVIASDKRLNAVLTFSVPEIF